jgi:hypothetical protein
VPLKGREVLNLVGQTSVRFAGILVGIVLTGWAARRLSPDAVAVILSLAAFSSVPGLLQLGLGNLSLQQVAHSHAQGRPLAQLTDVRGGFVIVFVLSMLATLATIIAVWGGWMPVAALPLAIVAIGAQWAMLADSVRLGRGRSLVSNGLQLCGLAICWLAMVISLDQPSPVVWLAIFAAYAAPFLSSLLSFGLLLRDAEFRQLISPARPFTIVGPVLRALPLYIANAAFALMLALPVIMTAVRADLTLSAASLACLRLWATALFTHYFALQPLTSVIMRHRYAPDGAAATRSIASIVALAGLVCLAGGAIFALAAPTFVHLWLGGVEVSRGLALQWGVIIAASALIMTGVFVAQILLHPFLSALPLVVVDGGMVLMMLSGEGPAVETMLIVADAAGLAAGLLAVVISLREISHARARETAA